MALYSVDKLISEARRIAADYRRATGKPLGISAEIARHDACQFLQLEPVENTNQGFDAVGQQPPRQDRRIQIKGRAIFDESKSGQRIGQLKTDQDWDSVVLVIMDENFETTEIYEAMRSQIMEELEQASASRSRRGAMSVARFKHLAQLVWTREQGLIGDEIWSNQAAT